MRTFCSAETLLLACGGALRPRLPRPRLRRPPVSTEPAMKSAQELGSIDEGATKCKTFEALGDQLLNCQKDGMQRVEYLAGDVRFFLRIAQDGTVRWAYLEDSTLGDRDTESAC